MKIYRAERMTAAEVEAVCGETMPAPGTVLSDGKALLAVATADGALRIRELQLAGKKRMDVEAFLLGFRDPQSYVCTPGTSRSVITSVRQVEG